MAEVQFIHPCQSCGACCAYFRVEFSSQENVPNEFCETGAPGKKIMRGTEAKHRPSCVALLGEVGKRVLCGIYEARSSTCRSFAASYENGYKNPRCDEARAKHGLSPLTKEAWVLLNSQVSFLASDQSFSFSSTEVEAKVD